MAAGGAATGTCVQVHTTHSANDIGGGAIKHEAAIATSGIDRDRAGAGRSDDCVGKGTNAVVAGTAASAGGVDGDRAGPRAFDDYAVWPAAAS